MKKLLLLIIPLLFLAGCNDEDKELVVPTDSSCSDLTIYTDRDNVKTYTKVYYDYFDTQITLTMYNQGEINSTDLVAHYTKISDIFKKYNDYSSKFDDIEDLINIYHINNNNQEDMTYIVSDELLNLFNLAKEYYSITNNKFNIALNPVISLWDNANVLCNSGSEDCALPDSDELNRLKEFIDFDNVIVNNDDNTLFVPSGMSFDLGAIAKGYATEIVSKYLKVNFDSYLINSGTSSLKFNGYHPDNRQFSVGLSEPIKDIPFRPSYLSILAPLCDSTIATSGDYERYFTFEDKDYHGIIDPITLAPTYHTRTVTIITKNAALSDILSTAVFLMPQEEGLEFINSLDDTEAIWYVDDGDIRYSENAESYIKV